jgi:hypothetical protein
MSKAVITRYIGGIIGSAVKPFPNLLTGERK